MIETKTSKKEALIHEIIAAIQDTKGEDIMLFDLSQIDNAVAETFIICSGNSNTQVNSIAGNIEKKVRNAVQERPWHTEGTENGMWVLIDYVHVVVHVFQKHIREYYDIEELWGDAKIQKIES